MPELLIELFSEEIPARMQARAAEDFCRLLHAQLGALMPVAPRGYYGPRRLTLVGELARGAETPGKEERGPRVGAPEAALDGFLRKHGATREALTQEGQFWVLNKPGETIDAASLLARAVPAVLRAFPWPKSMRWGISNFAWVRPLQRVLCVFDGAAVPFALAHGEDAVHGLVAGDETEGHRVLSPGVFAVRGFADYEEGLRARHVLVDAAERMRVIREGVAALAAAEGVQVVPDEALLAEVAGLVEWPVPLLGRIDAAFMDLPAEVMRTTMRLNQKYFSMCHDDGRAAACFGVVANIVPRDGGTAIVAGNERVLRARLSDARFFWDQDRKQRLEAYLPKLDSVVFHAKLGTQGQRVARLEALAEVIATAIGADVGHAMRAAKLAKADLATGMVGEFPELQGVMGRYYALGQHEPAEVAEAIGAHYRPLGPGDAVPTAPVSVAVGFGDKLDQLVGFFGANERPTGSGDPFGSRRAALGIIRIITENRLRVRLTQLIEAAATPYWAPGYVSDTFGVAVAAEVAGRRHPTGKIAGDLAPDFAKGVLDFLFDRLRVQLRAEGARHDIVAAVLGATPDDDLVRLLARADAVKALLETPDGTNLLAAYKRAANILRIEEKKDGPHDGPIQPDLLVLPEEQALADALELSRPVVAAALEAEDFAAAMAALAGLRAPVDAFFERVTVNDKNLHLRGNRLRLLSALRAATARIADFSLIEG